MGLCGGMIPSIWIVIIGVGVCRCLCDCGSLSGNVEILVPNVVSTEAVVVVDVVDIPAANVIVFVLECLMGLACS